MERSKKISIVLLFVISIACLLVGSIAYYRISISAGISANTKSAVFVLRDTESGEAWNNKLIELGQINPGDSGSFDVVLDATGSSVDMYATLTIDRGTGDTKLPTNLKFYTTSDHKAQLHDYYSFLETDGTTKEKLTIYWYWNPNLDDNEDSKFMNKSFNTTISVKAIQASDYSVMKNGAINKTEFWSDSYKPYIKTVTFSNDLTNLPTSCTSSNLCWDITESGSKKVYAYLLDTGLTVSVTDETTSTTTTKKIYNLHIASESPIFAPNNSFNFFADFSRLTQINFNNNFNTSKTNDMAYMFSNCSSLTTLDLSSFNTINVTNMRQMFQGCSSLTTLDISNFNTINLTNMYVMFYKCSLLESIDISSFNTLKVTNMGFLFSDCSKLTTLDLDNFDTSNVTDMGLMFAGCSSLKSLDLSNFNTINVTNMNDMFNSCSSLTTLDISNFNTSKLTSMQGLFSSCSSLINLNLISFDTSNVTNMEYMFYKCSKLTTTINIMNSSITAYTNIFAAAATDENAKITVNYIADASTLVDSLITTKTSNSNIVKGKQI